MTQSPCFGLYWPVFLAAWASVAGTGQPSRQLAKGLWQQGQEAMKLGHFDRAVHCYEKSLVVDPGYFSNHLSLAAAFIEKNDPARACDHLGKYVAANPGHLLARSRYAELLYRQHRRREACSQLEAVIEAAQEDDTPGAGGTVPAHTRIMEIAEEAQDDYAEHLHRGIGLYLLARRRIDLAEPEGEFPAQSLLCKAAAELTLAHKLKPHEARPSWYLFMTWTMLGQRQPAMCHLRKAGAAAPFTYLTPVERRRLAYAEQGGAWSR